MKRIIAIMTCLLVFAGIFTGCGASSSDSDKDSRKLKIVTTIFPEYDWVRNILGDKQKDVELTMLIDSGVDLHSYQPSTDDIVKISKCDIFIYVGGESDKWVDDALKQGSNKDRTVIDLFDVLGDKLKEEEHKEGMQHEHDHDEDEHHDESHEDHDHEHEEEKETDEHIWLSLKNAAALCEHICDKICDKDEANKDTYKANTKSYVSSLEKLDKQYKEAVDSSKTGTLIFADRFPFRYLVDD